MTYAQRIASNKIGGIPSAWRLDSAKIWHNPSLFGVEPRCKPAALMVGYAERGAKRCAHKTWS